MLQVTCTAADRLIAGVPECEVRRNADGSIDIAFYKERAQRLRREATLKLYRSIREFTRAWFRNVTEARPSLRRIRGPYVLKIRAMQVSTPCWFR